MTFFYRDENCVHVASETSLKLVSEQSSRGKAATIDMSSKNNPRGAQEEKITTKGLFSDSELAALESKYSDGMTAVQIVECFTKRGIRFSEATFRKYVQQRLLPRSRRVGRKGKNRGSLGLYPPKAVRRVNTIKSKMAEGYTIEDIQELFLKHVDIIETVQESLDEFIEEISDELSTASLNKREQKTADRELEKIERCRHELMEYLEKLSKRVARNAGQVYRNQGVAGNAEELL